MSLTFDGSTNTISGLVINSANITDGSIVNADINANAAIASTKLSGVTAGIEMADIWYLSSSFNGSANPITSNLVRYTANNSGSIGTNMTESSGIFTFPSTGIYRISLWTQGYRSGTSVRYAKVMIETTTNNSSYSTIPSGYMSYNSNNVSGGWYQSMSAEHFVDISDTSNCKVRFQCEQSSSSATMENLFIYFLRMGDT